MPFEYTPVSFEYTNASFEYTSVSIRYTHVPLKYTHTSSYIAAGHVALVQSVSMLCMQAWNQASQYVVHAQCEVVLTVNYHCSA